MIARDPSAEALRQVGGYLLASGCYIRNATSGSVVEPRSGTYYLRLRGRAGGPFSCGPGRIVRRSAADVHHVQRKQSYDNFGSDAA